MASELVGTPVWEVYTFVADPRPPMGITFGRVEQPELLNDGWKIQSVIALDSVALAYTLLRDVGHYEWEH